MFLKKLAMSRAEGGTFRKVHFFLLINLQNILGYTYLHTYIHLYI